MYCCCVLARLARQGGDIPRTALRCALSSRSCCNSRNSLCNSRNSLCNSRNSLCNSCNSLCSLMVAEGLRHEYRE
jgi:hypothetical protein